MASSPNRAWPLPGQNGNADPKNCPWSANCGFTYKQKIRLHSDGGFQRAHTRHAGGSNVGFLDGHAKWYPYKVLLTQVNMDWGAGFTMPGGDAAMNNCKDPLLYGLWCLAQRLEVAGDDGDKAGAVDGKGFPDAIIVLCLVVLGAEGCRRQADRGARAPSLPAWAPGEPSPEFLNAARTLKSMSPEEAGSGERSSPPRPAGPATVYAAGSKRPGHRLGVLRNAGGHTTEETPVRGPGMDSGSVTARLRNGPPSTVRLKGIDRTWRRAACAWMSW